MPRVVYPHFGSDLIDKIKGVAVRDYRTLYIDAAHRCTCRVLQTQIPELVL
jgi:hypothetical protein